MPVPTFEPILLPLLQLVADGQPHRLSDLIEQVSDHFTLTTAERSDMLASGTRRIASNVNWARTDLGKAGLIERVARGSIRITSAGRALLQEKPGSLNRRFLSERYASHAEFTRRVTPARPALGDGAGEVSPSSIAQVVALVETPEEAIDRSHRTLQESLVDELLERIRVNSPTFFERLVVQVLLAMGYGGSMSDAGQVLGRTGDGGIDGVIKETSLVSTPSTSRRSAGMEPLAGP